MNYFNFLGNLRFLLTVLAFVMFLGIVSGVSPLTWDNSSEWDNSVSESRVVHDSVGDHVGSGTLQLGYSNTDIANLNAYWRNDGDGTVLDYSGNNLDSNSEAGITQNLQGVFGTSALRLDSTDSSVNFGNPSKLDCASLNEDWTITGWVKPTSEGHIIGDSGSGVDTLCNIQVRDQDGDSQREFAFYIDDKTTIYGSTENVVNQWSYVTATYGNGEMRLYVNGSLDASSSQSGGIGVDWGGNPDFHYGYESGNGNSAESKLDEFRVYGRVLSATEVHKMSSSSGNLTTSWKNFSKTQNPSSLKLDSIHSSPAGSINVYLESDTDGDDIVDETSDPISLNNSGGPYSVEGLQEDSSRFRLDVRLSTSDVTATPTLSSVNLTAESTGPSICDSRGAQNECVSTSEHDISLESFTISSIFEVERSAVFNAVNGLAFIQVGNSSSLSGTWKGSFNISTPADNPPVIAPGAQFVPSNGDILID